MFKAGQCVVTLVLFEHKNSKEERGRPRKCPNKPRLHIKIRRHVKNTLVLRGDMEIGSTLRLYQYWARLSAWQKTLLPGWLNHGQNSKLLYVLSSSCSKSTTLPNKQLIRGFCKFLNLFFSFLYSCVRLARQFSFFSK